MPAGPMDVEYLAIRLFLVITLGELSSFNSLGNVSHWDRQLSFCSAMFNAHGSAISNVLDRICY